MPFAGAEQVQTSPEWSPRHDPGFARSWLSYLCQHFGEWTHPTQVWQTHDERQRRVLREVSAEVMLRAAQVWAEVETDARLGYRIVGVDPERYRYLHLHQRAEDRETEPCVGQLTIDEAGAVG